MAKKPLEYWQRRAGERLVESEALGKVAIGQLQSIYDQSLKNIEKEVQSIYENYAKNGVLDVAELKKAIGNDGAQLFLKKVEKSTFKLGLNPKKIYDERYLGRLTRLQALQEQVKLEVMAIAPQEEALSTRAYTKVIESSYASFQNDVELMGFTPSFSTIDKKVVDVMLKSVWAKDNYSNRVWGNNQKLAARLPTLLGAALLSGQAPEKTARQLRERYDVTRYESLRLVRTETAYFHNETEAQSYIDDGIEEYTLDVTLDGHTSKICLAVNESTIYKFKDRIVGQNWPPLHVFCRTVPRAILPGEIRKSKPTFQERVKRFQTVQDNDLLKEKWKKAMQQQMNPDKSTHDYNADMNILTQNLGKKIINQQQFNEKLNDLMAKIPEDYPLRGGLENIAKLNGWKKPDFNKNQAIVQGMLKDIDLAESGVVFDQDQAKFIVDNGIKFRNLRSGTDDVGGTYDYDTNSISIDVVNAKDFANSLGSKDYVNGIVQHELGHAIDRKGFRNAEWTSTPRFKEATDLVESYAISKYRLAKGIVDADVKAFFNNLRPEVYGTMAQTGESVQINGQPIKVYYDTFKYQTQPDELFAEAYAIYKTNQGWLQANAPKMFDFISSIFNAV